jgi:hypothetical protein
MDDDIKTDLNEIGITLCVGFNWLRIWIIGLILTKTVNESWGSVNGMELLDQLSDCQLLRDFALWS